MPIEITNELVLQERKMGWPEMVPAWAEVPDAKGKIYWYRWQDLTVAICEQLVEHHTRKARKAVERFKLTASKNSLATAGRNILYARLYRCQYFTLTGKTDSTEADMPFPIMSKDEARLIGDEL